MMFEAHEQRADRRDRQPSHHRCLPRRRRQLHRHCQRLRGWRVRRGRRARSQGTRSDVADRHRRVRPERLGARTDGPRPEVPDPRHWTKVSVGSIPSTSTSISATGPIPTRRSRRRWQRCTRSSSPARCATSAARTGWAARSSKPNGPPRTVAVHPSSACSRVLAGGRQIEADVLPACQRHGLGTMIYSPLAGGVLTGKYTKGEPAPTDSRAGRNEGWGARMLDEEASTPRTPSARSQQNRAPLRRRSRSRGCCHGAASPR